MKIKALYENNEGQHELNAVLTEDQLKFLIEYALLELLRKGLMIPEVHNDQVTLIEFGKMKGNEDAEAFGDTGHANKAGSSN
jgi:hypothetical protein